MSIAATTVFVLCEKRLEFVSDEYSGQELVTPKNLDVQ